MKLNRLASFVAGGAILASHFDLHGADPVLVGEWPGYARGQAQALVVAGNYAYVAAHSGGLHIIDFSDVSNPKRVGGYDKDGFYARAVAVSTHYAYVVGFLLDEVSQTSPGVLQIVDISNRAKPFPLATHDVVGHAVGVAISGNYAYVVGGLWDEVAQTNRGGLQIIDISNPANPRQVSGYDTGGSSSVSVSGGNAYITDNDGLQVFNISNPLSPQPVGRCSLRGQPYSVTVSGDFAYIAASPHWDSVNRVYVGGGLQVIDMSVPASPRWVGEYDADAEASSVSVSGNYAYLAASRHWVAATQTYGGGGLQIVDISNPANPQRAAEYLPSGNGMGITTTGNYALFLEGDQSLQVVDVSNPSNPQRIGGYRTDGSSRNLQVSGAYAYVASEHAGLEVINISNPANPHWTGSYPTEGRAYDVSVVGNYAYVAEGDRFDTASRSYNGSLHVVDVSDPSHPQNVGRYDRSGYCMAVATVGNYAYIAAGYAGLEVINISNPTYPRLEGACQLQGFAYGISVLGSYAYVADGDYGLQVVNVSNPTNPAKVGRCDTGGSAHGLTVSGQFAYVASGSRWDTTTATMVGGGLEIIDISDPYNPKKAGSYPGMNENWGVAVAGDYAYLAGNLAGFEVINIANPANPQRIGRYDTSGWALGVAISGEFAFVADGPRVLQILGVALPALSFQRAGNMLTLSWPSTAAGYVLQSASTLANGGNWQDVTVTPTDSNGQKSVTVAMGSAGFFRLRR